MIDNSNSAEEYEQECVICMSLLNLADQVREKLDSNIENYNLERTLHAACGHKFHRNCLET